VSEGKGSNDYWQARALGAESVLRDVGEERDRLRAQNNERAGILLHLASVLGDAPIRVERDMPEAVAEIVAERDRLRGVVWDQIKLRASLAGARFARDEAREERDRLRAVVEAVARDSETLRSAATNLDTFADGLAHHRGLEVVRHQAHRLRAIADVVQLDVSGPMSGIDPVLCCGDALFWCPSAEDVKCKIHDGYANCCEHPERHVSIPALLESVIGAPEEGVGHAPRDEPPVGEVPPGA